MKLPLLRSLLLVAGAALLGGGLALPWLALDAAPWVQRRAPPSTDDVRHAHQLLKAHQVGGGSARRVVSLSTHEAGLLLDRALAQRWPGAAADVEFMPGVALLKASVPLPDNPFGGWLNLRAVLLEHGDEWPALDELTLGRVAVPRWLARWALQTWQARAADDTRLARDLVRSVRFGAGRVQVAYDWRAETRDRLMATLVDAPQQARLRVYTERLAELMARRPADGVVPLPELLPPMFALARERSASAEGGAVDALAAENRAAFVTLALYAVGQSLGAVVPEARTWRRPPPRTLVLGGRDDTAQHWLVSAALAAEGGGPLADAVGLYKEMLDARGGSGFSFNDLAADLAGARVGRFAVAQPRALQARLADGVAETVLLPPTADLPEFLSERELRRRFGGVGAPAYRRLVADIETRIAALPLLAP